MTRTIEALDTATFRPSPAAEHTKEGPALNSLELGKEEPVFIDIPLVAISDPKVFKVFKESIFVILFYICPSQMRPRSVDLTDAPSHPVQSDHFLGVLEDDLVDNAKTPVTLPAPLEPTDAHL